MQLSGIATQVGAITATSLLKVKMESALVAIQVQVPDELDVDLEDLDVVAIATVALVKRMSSFVRAFLTV